MRPAFGTVTAMLAQSSLGPGSRQLLIMMIGRPGTLDEERS